MQSIYQKLIKAGWTDQDIQCMDVYSCMENISKSEKELKVNDNEIVPIDIALMGLGRR